MQVVKDVKFEDHFLQKWMEKTNIKEVKYLTLKDLDLGLIENGNHVRTHS